MMPSFDTVDPVYRWKNAHHLFFVLIQGLILSHRRLEAALTRGDHTAIARSLNLSIELFQASMVAFRHGTDYPPQIYQRQVRPTMGPPEYSEGFSDMQSVDHIALLKQMASVRPRLGSMPAQLLPIQNRYFQTLSALYENHSLVCERCVGAAPSLKQGAGNIDSEKEKLLSAPESIRQIYKVRALALAGYPARREAESD